MQWEIGSSLARNGAILVIHIKTDELDFPYIYAPESVKPVMIEVATRVNIVVTLNP